MENEQLLKDLVTLLFKVNKGAMELKKPLRKLLFTHSQDKTGEQYIEAIQTEIEQIINRHAKKSLTLRKGIPYSIPVATVFINQVLEEIR